MSEVTTPNTYAPTSADASQAKTLAGEVRKAADGYRTAWVNLCTFVGGIRAKYANAGVKSEVFYGWVLDQTGFAKATIADGILYAETLPTLPKGSESLDKSWVTTLAKARPEDRAKILETVEKMPAKRTAGERKAKLQDLAQKSAAKVNPEKSRNAETRKSERAKTIATEQLTKALAGMPRKVKGAILSGPQAADLVMLAIEYGTQHGEYSLLAAEKVNAERPKAVKPKASVKTEPVPVS